MTIQDNIHGALLISAIDFLLSFVIIGGIGLILAAFPLINRFGRRDEESRLIVSPEMQLSREGSVYSPEEVLRETKPASVEGIHPGLTDQQLLVLLTAAACEALGEPIRIGRFRPLTAKDWNWAAQGRTDLQSHRLK